MFQSFGAATLKAQEVEDNFVRGQQVNVLWQSVKIYLVYSPSAANLDVEVHQNDELNRSTVQPLLLLLLLLHRFIMRAMS